MMFRSFDQIDVRLISSIATPYELAVASARTCYSGKGIVLPSDVSENEKSIEIRDRIASSTLGAGHLTTRQHASFVFAISGVSRQFIWSFLHSHPYYNSEQVSQRYVRVKPDSFLVPPLTGACEKVFSECIRAQIEAYDRLIDLLKVPIGDDYFQRFPARKRDRARWQSAIDKRAFEVARYVLGVGTTAHLYHTISALTLLRYARLCELFETPTEQRVVIGKMLDAVKSVDPLFENDIMDPLPLEQTLEYRIFQEDRPREHTRQFVDEFDSELQGGVSRLLGASEHPESTLASAVRTAIGRARSELSDEKAVEMVLDPASNPILADTLNPSVMDRLSQCLHHVQITFQKKISHTADSQDQRHRTVLGSRPILFLHYSGKPDYIAPFGVTESQAAWDLYGRTMEQTFEAVNCCLNAGLSREVAFYLLPNAFPIRMISSGSLHSWHHKWKMRTCYNAQEEIFRCSVEEIKQVSERFPLIGKQLRAPCTLRLKAGLKPYCPEGDHFCGLPVWKYSIDQYQRKSL